MLPFVLIATLIQAPSFVQFKTEGTKQRGVVIKSFEAEMACDDGGSESFGRHSASYPQFSSSSARDAEVNRLIEQSVFARLGIDKTCRAAPDPENTDPFTSNIEETCKIVRLSRGLVSIECGASWDGGAHPDASLRSLNIDRRSAQPLEPQQIFVDPQSPRLAALLRKQVEDILKDEERSEEALDQIVESLPYEVSFTPEGVTFQYYQRLLGGFTVMISYREIRPFLTPEMRRALR